MANDRGMGYELSVRSYIGQKLWIRRYGLPVRISVRIMWLELRG